jgi:hypothetical protein
MIPRTVKQTPLLLLGHKLEKLESPFPRLGTGRQEIVRIVNTDHSDSPENSLGDKRF